MEYLSGETLKDYIKTEGVIQESEAKKIVFQMCLALNHLHEKNIAHRDIKLENFLFKTKGSLEVKLIDFGLAYNHSKTLMNSHVGTPYYVAPEILQEQSYNSLCDEWSLGVCIYKMLTGHYPFVGKDTTELFGKILFEQYNEKNLAHISKHGNNFVKSLLAKNRYERKTVTELLHHPWLAQYHIEFIKINSHFINPSIFDNIVNVKKINTFGIQLLKILITFFPHPSDYDSVIGAFFCADYSLTGFITFKGLSRLFKEYNRELSNDDLISIMNKLCFFEESFITFTEFMVAAINRYDWIVTQKLIPKLFNFLDIDKSYFVTIDNLVELFRRFGYFIDESYISNLIKFMGNDALVNGFNFESFETFIMDSFF